MADLTIACSVDRTELGAGVLNVNDGTTYVVFAFGLGGREWEYFAVKSRWVPGEVRVDAHLEEASRILGVRVKGASVGAMNTAIDTLIDALSQSTYTVTSTIDSASYVWNDCGQASMVNVPRGSTEQGSLDRFGLMARQQDLLFTIPCDPANVTGPW